MKDFMRTTYHNGNVDSKDGEQGVLLNAYQTGDRGEQCIHQLFEAQVESTPEKLAVSAEKRSLRYRELNARANQLARYLQELGVGPETLVGICMERSVDMFVALLAILKAGGAYLPLDPSYPVERLAFMLDDSQTTVLLSTEQLSATFVNQEIKIVLVDAEQDIFEQYSIANLPCRVQPQNLAYLIYTSGSTGKPKGVLINHRSLVNHAIAFSTYFSLQADDRALQFFSISFDAAAEEIFPTLISGATIVLRPEDVPDPLELFYLLSEKRITILNLPTAYWHLWISQLSAQSVPPPPSLRLVVVGGEKVSSKSFIAWQKWIGNSIRWANTYGPTETTITATIYESDSSSRKYCDQDSIPIGLPIANTQVYVLDISLQIVPVGVVGELYISGAGLARGYLNQPELTRERFVPCPFDPDPQARMYRTGDLVRYLPDGQLEFVGRADQQVKIRGFRIELGEIEANLCLHPAIKEAIVLAREDTDDNKYLVAYLIHDQAIPSPSPNELRTYLRQQLPNYMLPVAFVFMNTFPLTINGKVDRNALPEPKRFLSLTSEPYAAPRTSIEQTLALMWANVLRYENVGIHDNFFDMGGHSLLATLLISRIKETFQVETSLRDLLKMPTIAELANKIDSMKQNNYQTTNNHHLRPSEPKDHAILSFGQQRFWVQEQLMPGTCAYTIPLALRLNGPLDPTALEHALKRVILRQKSLRTHFVLQSGEPTQVIDPAPDCTLAQINLSTVVPTDRENRLQELLQQLVQLPFNLNQGPLFRATLFHLHEHEEYLLLLCMHHIISDGWSIDVLLHDLAAFYQAAIGAPSATIPPPLPIQYTDFALWQRQRLQGEILQQHLDYWIQQLSGAPSLLALPLDHPRPSQQTLSGASVPVTISAEMTQALHRLARQEDVTLFMILLATFQLLLARYSGQQDIVVGTPIANRTQSEVEEVIGFFVNTLALRTNLSDNPSIRDFLAQVREICLEAYAHQDLPFERLVEELKPERNPSYSPLIQVLFVLQNTPLDLPSFPGINVHFEELDTQTSQFDLTLELTEEGEQLQGRIEYKTDLFERETVVRLIEHWQVLLEGMVKSERELPVGNLPLLTEVEQERMLWLKENRNKWNIILDTTALSPSKRALLAKYRQLGRLTEKKVVNQIEPRRPDAQIPLSIGQQQMWLLNQLIPDVPVYNESVTVRIAGELNVDALRSSLNAFIARHELWRTTFPLVDGEPMQVVQPELTLEMPVVDLRSFPVAEREARAVQIASAQAVPLFDLTRLPLLRATLVHLDDDDHRLYLTIHHILFDGVIYQVLLPQLYAFYTAFVEGKPSPLPPLPVQYGDYAIWQREQLQSPEITNQIAYWKKQLAGAPTTLDLPTDHPYPTVESHRGARLPFTLSDELIEQLTQIARSENATLYQILAASFNTLLYHYTGQTDMLTGAITAGRRPAQTQDLIGVFLNPLVIRNDLSGNPTFRELLHRIRDVVVEAQDHQDVPFEYLVKELRPQRDPSRNPLIQVLISLEPPLPPLASGWTITQADAEAKTAKFELLLELDNRADGFVAWLEYNTDLFEEATAARLIRHWQMVLNSIVADPSQHIADIAFLTPEEQQTLLHTWNETTIDFPHDQGLHQLFAAQARRTPTAIAARYANQTLSYQDLERKANQLASYLQQHGVGPDVLVGIYIERSLEMLIALLGVLKAGGTYVPLDPAYPQERLAYMLEDSQALLLLTQHSLVASLPGAHPGVLCLDTDWPMISQSDPHAITTAMTPQQGAYIIYTSGSTGRPKGVQISHAAVVNLLQAMREPLAITANDIVLGITTLSFDIAAAEIFLPLCHGATLVIESRATAMDGAQLLAELTTARPTLLQATPATWQLLLAAGLKTLKGKRIISTGEALTPELREQLLRCQPDAFWNLYGPTETTIWATADLVTEAQSTLTIGRPLANTQTYILNAARQPTPIGVPGELYIGGIQLASGYLHQAALTAEKFVHNPFSPDSESRLYRTGDLACYLPDGKIEYLGRIDHQVKLRGYRIELGEIETLLRQAPEVEQAIVTVREDTPGDKRLVAYITPSQQHESQSEQASNISIQDLQQRLRAQLPEYMLPSTFVQLTALPVSPSGKIDRQALPAPEVTSTAEQNSFVAPETETQQMLQHIWEELLHKTPVGIQDNFFLAGGHSLLAARMIARVEQILGKRIALTTLFTHPTIEQLSEVLEQQEELASKSMIVEIQKGAKAQTPFFFFHGDPNHGSFYCFKLAAALGSEQPFYACSPYPINNGEPLPSFAEIATIQLAAIREIQPEGPYQLGGFCNGGLTAYEVARQLQAANQEVSLLFMVDPTTFKNNDRERKLLKPLTRIIRRTHEQELDLFLRLRYIYRYLFIASERQYMREHRAGLSALQALIPPPIAELRKDWFELFRWILSDYAPQTPYTGKAVFVLTGNEESGREWQGTLELQNGTIHHLQDGHIDWVKYHLDVLATYLGDALQTAKVEKENK